MVEGNVDRKARAVPGFAVNFDPTAVVLDDTLSCRKTESGPTRLRRIECLEYATARFHRVNYGNLDRALVDFTGLEVVNSQVQFQNNLGLGYHFGAEYTFYVNQQFGLAFGAEYFVGGSKLAFVGSYTGASTAGGLESQPIDYPDSRLDFAGLELSISVIFSP